MTWELWMNTLRFSSNSWNSRIVLNETNEINQHSWDRPIVWSCCCWNVTNDQNKPIWNPSCVTGLLWAQINQAWSRDPASLIPMSSLSLSVLTIITAFIFWLCVEVGRPAAIEKSKYLSPFERVICHVLKGSSVTFWKGHVPFWAPNLRSVFNPQANANGQTELLQVSLSGCRYWSLRTNGVMVVSPSSPKKHFFPTPVASFLRKQCGSSLG